MEVYIQPQLLDELKASPRYMRTHIKQEKKANIGFNIDIVIGYPKFRVGVGTKDSGRVREVRDWEKEIIYGLNTIRILFIFGKSKNTNHC